MHNLIKEDIQDLDDMFLKNKKSVLNDGFVRYVDHMGTDASIVQAARVSYGAGTKTPSDDQTLIRYLMRHKHTTPFEMCELKLHVRVPMDCWRQWIRHRMASVNEYSTRYSEAIDSCQTTAPDEWRVQSTTNKQGSGNGKIQWPGYKGADYINSYRPKYNPKECVTVYPANDINHRPEDTPGKYLSDQEKHLQEFARTLYEERLAFGVAKEQARKDLPLSSYTEAYWKIDLHNLLHFLRLRMDKHAQWEIRQYANIIGEEIVAKLWPITWKAFQDYVLNSINLTALDIQGIQYINTNDGNSYDQLKNSMNKRELEEFREKLSLLNIGEI